MVARRNAIPAALLGLTAGLLMLVTGSALAAPAAIGAVDLLRGEVSAFGKDGVQRTLSKDAAIFAGDEIASGKRSVAAIKLNDGAKFLVGANSRLALDDFVYGKSQDEDKLLARVVTGAFRFVSGLVAKRRPASMSVRIGAVATVGVRGTTVGGEVIGDSATVVLLEPEDGQANTAIDVFNDFGSVSIDEPGYGTRIPDARSGPTPPERMRLRAIENLLRNIQSATRASVRMRVP